MKTAGVDRRVRISLALALPLALAALAWLLAGHGPQVWWHPGCLFHRATALHCPGCGMTRAAHAALHGDLAAALRFNPLGMLLFPVALLGCGLHLAGWARGRPLPWTMRVGGRWAWAIVAAILLFWVARNLPWWPFTLLAPG